MKIKILNFLKEKWWKILLYFLVISLGMFVPFIYIDKDIVKGGKNNA